MSRDLTVVVIGGGVAGISCVESLFQEFENSTSHFKTVVLISESTLVKRVTSHELRGHQLEWLNVEECQLEVAFSNKPEGLKLITIKGKVLKIIPSSRTLFYTTGTAVNSQGYDVISLCTGSKPRQLSLRSENLAEEITSKILVIRDTSTVLELKHRLSLCRKIVIIGNGGIGLELVDKIATCDKVWIIRDQSIGFTFFDSGAAKFLLDARRTTEKIQSRPPKNQDHTSTIIDRPEPGRFGPSLGPDWASGIKLEGNSALADHLDIIYNDELENIDFDVDGSRLIVTTLSGKKVDCDLIVAAIGVVPDPPPVEGDSLLLCEQDRGVVIDEQMRTSVPYIYAAGDVVSCDKWTHSDLWFQMRLWVQARQMGHYAGKCIVEHLANRDPSIYFNFDCFTHCTTFFGYKLILLGRYNLQHFAQDESPKCEIIARVNPSKDYVKLIIKEGRIIGAVLVGESGLEETVENLIQDQIDVSAYKDQILDGTVDIEDYFD